MYFLAPFIMQNFKKSLEQIQSYEDPPFLGQKYLFCPQPPTPYLLTISKCFSFHPDLSTSKKFKVIPLMKNW